ncbi:MAG TPA: phosphatidylglycerophosphatase A [Vicinamibacteria bacterium]|nr:phosphatidylglycerophosphatase A [Vicinamibacteria bacterium]
MAARSPLDLAATTIATGLGSGYSPFAPGTAGSLVGLALFWPMRTWPFAWQAAACVALFVLGAAAATRVANHVGREDPGIVVVDEIVGMWITLLLVPVTAWSALVGFFLFRAMDVWKPYPARDLEALHDGLGIMADDVAAGLYANVSLHVALVVWNHLGGRM